MATAWYYALNDKQNGPVTDEIIKALLANGQLSLDDLVWRKGLAEWVKVSQVRELTEPAQPTPQPETAQMEEEEEELHLVSDMDEVPHKAAQPVSTPEPQLQPIPAQWYYTCNGQQQGPVTVPFLKEKAASGELLPTDRLWKDGLKDWIAAKSLPGLKFPSAVKQSPSKPAQAPPPPPPPPPAPRPTAAPFETQESATPSENSIFEIMSDPSFAAAPAIPGVRPNVDLAAPAWEQPAWEKKKKKIRKNTTSDDMTDDPVSTSAVLAIMFLVGAIIFLGLGIWRSHHLARLSKEGITAEGIVTHVDKTRRKRSMSYNYTPTVSFTTEDGQQMTVKPESSGEITVGQRVEMIYLPDDPTHAEINGAIAFTFLNTWLWMAAWLFIFSIGNGIRWHITR